MSERRPSHCQPVSETARAYTDNVGTKPVCKQEYEAASVHHHPVHLPGSARQAGRSSVMFPMFYKTQADFNTRSQERKPRLSALIFRFESDTPVQSRCQGLPSKLHFTFHVAEMNCQIVKSLNLPLPYHQVGKQPSLQWTASPEL